MINLKKLSELDMEVVNKPWSKKTQEEFSTFLRTRKARKTIKKSSTLKPALSK